MFSACLCHLAREKDSRRDIINALLWESYGTAVFNFSSLMLQAKNLTGFKPSSFFHNLIIDILLKFFPKKDLLLKFWVFVLKEGEGKKPEVISALTLAPRPCFISLDPAKWASLCLGSAVSRHILFLSLRRPWVYFSLCRRCRDSRDVSLLS